MSDSLIALARARLVATGVPLEVSPPTLLPRCATEAELDSTVRDYYTFFNESLAKDASFLIQMRPVPQVDSLRRLLYDLRTASNHADNPRADEAAARWRMRYDSAQAAADSLAVSLSGSLEALSRCAIAVSRDPSEAKKWRELVSVEVGAVFAAVAADLGLSFTDNNRRRMVRVVEKRLEVQPGRGDRKLLVAEYCAQEILSNRRPLPVSYDRVLDALGLLRTQGASGALLVAHSVAEVAPGLREDEFLARVSETWRIAVAK